MSLNVLLLCRLCGSSDNRNADVFTDITAPNSINLKEKILIVTGLIIVPDDVITTKICIDCKNTVEQMYNFRKKVYDTNIKLLSAVRSDQNTPKVSSVKICTQNQKDNFLVNNAKKQYNGNSTKTIQKLDENYIENINQIKNNVEKLNEICNSSVISNQSEDNEFSDEIEWDVEFPLDDISESQSLQQTIEPKSHTVRPFIEKIEAKYKITVDPEIPDFDFDACHVSLERMKLNIVSDRNDSLVIANRRNRTLKRSIDDETLLPDAYCVPLRLKSLSVIPALRYTRDNINVMFSEKNSQNFTTNNGNYSQTNVSCNVTKKLKNSYDQNAVQYLCHICNQHFQCHLFLNQHINTSHGESVRNNLLQLEIPQLGLNKNYKLYHRKKNPNNREQIKSVLVPIPFHQTQHNINISSLPIFTCNQAVQVQNNIVHSTKYQKLKQNPNVLITQFPATIRTIKNIKLTNNNSYGLEQSKIQSSKSKPINNKLIDHCEEQIIKHDEYDDINNSSGIDISHRSEEHEDHCYCIVPNAQNFKKAHSILKPKQTIKILSPSKINSIIENKLKVMSSVTN